jgi:hypothetical protein
MIRETKYWFNWNSLDDDILKGHFGLPLGKSCKAIAKSYGEEYYDTIKVPVSKEVYEDKNSNLRYLAEKGPDGEMYMDVVTKALRTSSNTRYVRVVEEYALDELKKLLEREFPLKPKKVA